MRREALKNLFLGLLSLAVVFYLLPQPVLAATEPDNDNDAYDQISCQGPSEDDVEDVDPNAVQNPNGMIDLPGSSSRDYGNDPDEYSVFPNNNFDLPFDAGGGGQNFSFDPTYTQDERSRVNDSYYPEPEVSFEQASNNAEPGQDVVVSINSGTFQAEQAPGQGFYYATFVDGKFLNGYNAGADWSEVEELQVAVDDPARPDCGSFYRQPKVDKDKDGMDDNWELRYGLNPADPSDAALDSDQDGYLADLYPNALGEFVNPAPNVLGAVLGDGSFTNYEEYVFGTNPLVSDSDGDGFNDEQDLVGLGQQTIKFKATKDYDEGPYELHSIVVGSVQKRDEQENKLIKIDSASKKIYSRRPEDLEVSLQVVTAVAKAGELLQIKALPSSTKARPLTLKYDWTVNGELQTAQSGLSKQTLSYVIPEGSKAGDTFVVQAQIANPETGQISKGQKTITLGDGLLIDYDPLSIDSGAVVTLTAVLTAGNDPADYLFLWTLDGKALKSDSKLGANQLSLAITKRGGSSYDLNLEVLDRQSQLFAQTKTQIKVQKPSVDIVLTPAEPTQNDIVVVRAVTKHFSAPSLIYSFVLDGKTQESKGPQISFEAGQAGLTHSLNVRVTSSESTQQAGNTLDFTTKKKDNSLAVTRVGPGIKTGLAGLLSATSWGKIGLLTLLGIILTASTLLIFLNLRAKYNFYDKQV